MAERPNEPLDLSRAERIFVRISIVQTILAVTGFLIGVIALFAALNEADAVRKQQMASVWPHITIRDFNYGLGGEKSFQLVVGNRGIGPARIMSAEVLLDGKRVKGWQGLVGTLTEGIPTPVSTVRVAGSVLSPGEDLKAFGVDASYAGDALVSSVRSLARSGRVNVVICYCSVFDDCFVLDAAAEQTSPVEACPAIARDQMI